MSHPECQNPPCSQALDVMRIRGRVDNVERGVSVLRSDMSDTRGRLAVTEQHQENFAIHLDRLADIVQELRFLVVEIKGAVTVLTDRPSVIVNTPPERSHTPASSLEVGNGTWKLRARGMLPMAVVLVVALVALAWAVRHWL